MYPIVFSRVPVPAELISYNAPLKPNNRLRRNSSPFPNPTLDVFYTTRYPGHSETPFARQENSPCFCYFELNSLVMGKSIRIDSRCRIVMKNFDSVPQLQYNALATCITVLQDRVMAHIRVIVATRFCQGS